jgi:hypothetical protein
MAGTFSKNRAHGHDFRRMSQRAEIGDRPGMFSGHWSGNGRKSVREHLTPASTRPSVNVMVAKGRVQWRRLVNRNVRCFRFG